MPREATRVGRPMDDALLERILQHAREGSRIQFEGCSGSLCLYPGEGSDDAQDAVRHFRRLEGRLRAALSRVHKGCIRVYVSRVVREGKTEWSISREFEIRGNSLSQ